MRAFALVFVLLGLPAQDADEQYSYVAALAEKGLHERVVREARAFLEAHPGHPKADLARYRLGCALFDLHREAEARAPLGELAGRREFEFASEVQFRLGQCLSAAGESAPAEACFQRVLSGGKDYLRAPTLALLAQSELGRKDYAQSLTHFEALAQVKDPKGEYAGDARCGRAWCLYRLGRAPEALALAREAARSASEARAGEMVFLQGECLLDQKDARAALEAYRRVRSGAFEPAALRGAGFALAALGEHAGAAREFGTLVERFPDSPYRAECALQQGVELCAAGDARAAAAALASPALDQDPEALAWRARAQAEGGDAAGALATLARALQLKPARALEERLVLQRAELLTAQGRGEEAQKDYDRIGSDRALLAAAVSDLQAKRWSAARARAARLLESFPQSPLRVDALLALGEGLFGEQHYAEAEQAFQAAAGEDRDPARQLRARSRCAWSAYLAGDPARAARAFDELAQASSGAPEVAEAAFMAGRAREDAGDKAGARAAYAECVQRFPRAAQQGEARLRAALLAEGAEGPGTQELEALAGSLKDGALVARAHYELAERLSAAGRGPEACAHYRAAAAQAEAGEFGPRARYGLAWSLFQLGQHEESARELGALLERQDLAPALVPAVRELAVWIELRRGALPEARRRWTEYLAADGWSDERAADLLHALCAALLEKGERAAAQAAIGDFSKRARSEAGRARAGVERALVLADGGDTEAAQRELERAQQQGAGGVYASEALFKLGETHFAAGADARAIPLYEAAARSADASVAPAALYKAGFARLRSGDAAGAERSFAALVERYPGSELLHESLFLLGEARFRQHELEAAVEALERVRREAPRHAVMPKVLFRLGVAQGEREHWRECADALGELVRANKDFPNLAEAELWRGRACAGLGDARGARSAWERVLALDKGLLSAQAHLELGRLAFGAGDSDAALSEFLKVAMLYAGDEEVAEALVLAGQVLEEQGQREQALLQYREVLAKHDKARYAAEAQKRITALGSR